MSRGIVRATIDEAVTPLYRISRDFVSPVLAIPSCRRIYRESDSSMTIFLNAAGMMAGAVYLAGAIAQRIVYQDNSRIVGGLCAAVATNAASHVYESYRRAKGRTPETNASP